MAARLAPSYQERCLWHAQVQAPATEADAGASLPPSADVVVVGAGICGLAAADTLARGGRSVVVVDKEALGWGASSRNGGMVIPELKAGPVALEARYGSLGRRLYDEVNEAFDHVEAVIAGEDGRGGIDCDYERSGQLYLAHSPRHAPELRDMAIEHGEVLSEEIRFVPRGRLAGEIGSDAFYGGVVIERTGGLHPAKFHAGLARRAIESGAHVFDRTAATWLSWEDFGDEPGHLVTTTRGPIRARDVIVATNAYADDAVPGVQARVLPVGSYLIATEVLDPDLARSVAPTGRMMVDTRNFLAYWRLTPDGRLAFGGRRSLDAVDVAEARDFLYDKMVSIHPQLGEAEIEVEYAWGGNVAVTLDRLPHVGVSNRAWYATGCNGSGVALLPWLGHRIAQVLLKETAPPAFAELEHPKIPLRSWRSAYLPLVSRWFAFQDAR